MRTADEDILRPHLKTDYGGKMWRAIITQPLVSFDPLPYGATTNNNLLYEVDLPGRICTLRGGVGGEGKGSALGEWCKSGSFLLTKYVLFGDGYGNREDRDGGGQICRIYGEGDDRWRYSGYAEKRGMSKDDEVRHIFL